MSDAALVVLSRNLANLSSSARWLRRSYARCLDIGARESYTDDPFDAFENLCSSYARTIDLAGLFASVLKVVPELLGLADKLIAYCRRYEGPRA